MRDGRHKLRGICLNIQHSQRFEHFCCCWHMFLYSRMSDQFGNHPDFILSSQVFLEIKYVHYAANFYHNSLMDEVLTSHKFLDDKALSISWHFLTILLTAILSGAATATVSNGKHCRSSLKHKNFGYSWMKIEISVAIIVTGQNWITYNC